MKLNDALLSKTTKEMTQLELFAVRARSGEKGSWIFDGKYTIEHAGEHRTFQVRTQPKDATFLPGERIVSLLVGPDNQRNYDGFGFVRDCGIRVWKKKQGTKEDDGSYTPSPYEWYADMLAVLVGKKLSRFHAAGYEGYTVSESVRCAACQRELTDPVSIEVGMGPICRTKI